MRRTTRWPAFALAFSTVVAAVWIGAAVLAAGHGFDTTDEGFYLLSYRWWAVDHRNFTGAAYLYGPVFDLLGHDIAGLRMVRLVTIVAVHAVFGWSFLRWLRIRRPDAPPTRLWEAAGTAAIVAAGGAVYGWLPATPGYNDPVLLGALLGLAAVFAMAAYADRGVPAPAWLPFALGATTVPILLAKWAALPVVLLLLGAALITTRQRVRCAAWLLAGVAVTVATVHLAVVPLTVAIPPLIEVNRLLADGSMSLPVLLERYWTTSLPMLEKVVVRYGPLLIGGVLAARARRPVPRAAAFAGLAVAVWFAVTRGGLDGGAAHVLKFVVPLVAVIVFALVTAAAGRMTRCWPLLGTLVLLPLVYALGTGNIPLKVSVNAFGAWMAVLVAVLTGVPRARALTAAVAAAALLATASIATGGLWRHPYRTVPRGEATATVPGVPALASVRLDPRTAGEYADLRARLAPWVEPAGRAIIGFDKMAGVVLLLDGRSVGELWYASNDRTRSAAGIVAACTGDPWWGDRPPILIFNRPVYRADRAVLDRCGFRIGDNYRLLTTTAGLTVYVPG